ncbi:GNAT family N-acetyltransferase [Patulibacter sp. SYSU D01012]|uniref:GNAT family N-acetyltransferase n=1 Tax=Patulibacter sp. SYSU D01012 TaxID=2817381 RepID=UPI001B302B18|nr:GNAT family N-acetyltransferase [Patulibacter sp. SYSU D01012]
MASPVTVSRLTEADAPGCARVLRSVADERRWIATPAGTPLEQLEERFRRQAAEDDTHACVLRVGEEIAGTASVAAGGGARPHALGMAIAAPHRGRGGGSRLLDAVLAAAAADDRVAKVTLEAWQHNAAAIALYASRGFVVEGVLREHYAAPTGDGRWSSVVMGWWPGRPTPGA